MTAAPLRMTAVPPRTACPLPHLRGRAREGASRQTQYMPMGPLPRKRAKRMGPA
jgi:hypothetical protein